jgi:hypothetical protein
MGEMRGNEILFKGVPRKSEKRRFKRNRIISSPMVS